MNSEPVKPFETEVFTSAGAGPKVVLRRRCSASAVPNVPAYGSRPALVRWTLGSILFAKGLSPGDSDGSGLSEVKSGSASDPKNDRRSMDLPHDECSLMKSV